MEKGGDNSWSMMEKGGKGGYSWLGAVTGGERDEESWLQSQKDVRLDFKKLQRVVNDRSANEIKSNNKNVVRGEFEAREKCNIEEEESSEIKSQGRGEIDRSNTQNMGRNRKENNEGIEEGRREFWNQKRKEDDVENKGTKYILVSISENTGKSLNINKVGEFLRPEYKENIEFEDEDGKRYLMSIYCGDAM